MLIERYFECIAVAEWSDSKGRHSNKLTKINGLAAKYANNDYYHVSYSQIRHGSILLVHLGIVNLLWNGGDNAVRQIEYNSRPDQVVLKFSRSFEYKSRWLAGTTAKSERSTKYGL